MKSNANSIFHNINDSNLSANSLQKKVSIFEDGEDIGESSS